MSAVARVLRAHILDEYANECSCKGWEHFEDPYGVRLDSFVAHQAEMLAPVIRERDTALREQIAREVEASRDQYRLATGAGEADLIVRVHDDIARTIREGGSK